MTILNKEMRDICDLVNKLQNENNRFINFSIEDVEQVYSYVKEKDLDLEDTIQLLKDLAYV